MNNFYIICIKLPEQPTVARSVSMHKQYSNLRMYTAYMMAWVKTTAKYGLDTTIHGLNKGSVVMSGYTEKC